MRPRARARSPPRVAHDATDLRGGNCRRFRPHINDVLRRTVPEVAIDGLEHGELSPRHTGRQPPRIRERDSVAHPLSDPAVRENHP